MENKDQNTPQIITEAVQAPQPANVAVDTNLYSTTTPVMDSFTKDELSPYEVANSYNKAGDMIQALNQNNLNDIYNNNRSTIGTDRGGQQSLLAGVNDNYMIRRYSSPAVESLVNDFKTTGSQMALNRAMTNELAKRQKEAENAVKSRQKRDRARAIAQAIAEQNANSNSVGNKMTGDIVAQGLANEVSSNPNDKVASRGEKKAFVNNAIDYNRATMAENARQADQRLINSRKPASNPIEAIDGFFYGLAEGWNNGNRYNDIRNGKVDNYKKL